MIEGNGVMKAAVLKEFGQPLIIEEKKNPGAGTL